MIRSIEDHFWLKDMLYRYVVVVYFAMLIITNVNGQQISSTKSETVPSFLNFPLTFISNNQNDNLSLSSTMNCIGENFNSAASYLYRTCEYNNLCYHPSTQQIVYIQSQEEYELIQYINKLPNSYQQQHYITISSIVHDTHGSNSIDSRNSRTTVKKVSLGTVRNLYDTSTTRNDNTQLYEWSPTIITNQTLLPGSVDNGYFLLPNDTVLFPIQFTASASSSSLWMDLFAVYITLHMFGYESSPSKKKPVFLIVLNDSSNSSIYDDNSDVGYFNIISSPFWSIFNITKDNIGFVGRSSSTAALVKHFSTNISKNSYDMNSLICAKSGIAGLGILATHTIIGRGIIINTFRDYILSNFSIRLQPPPSDIHSQLGNKFLISIAVHSPSIYDTLHTAIEENIIPLQSIKDYITIQKVDDLQGSSTTAVSYFHQQIQIASTTMVFIVEWSTTTTSKLVQSHAYYLLPIVTCLPKDAIIIVMDSISSSEGDNTTETIRKLEQEYISSIATVQLHWLTIPVDLTNSNDDTTTTIRQQVVSIIEEKLLRIDSYNDER